MTESEYYDVPEMDDESTPEVKPVAGDKEYLVECTSFEKGRTNDGSSETVSFRFKLPEFPDAETVYHNVTFPSGPDDPKASNKRRFMKRFLIHFGLDPMHWAPSEMIGVSRATILGLDDYQGRQRNQLILPRFQ